MKRNFSIPKGDKLLINEKGRRRYIEIEKITHITCVGQLSTIHILNNKPVSVYKSLKYFETEFKNYKFVRTNHNSLCNLCNVVEYKKINNKRILLLINGEKIEISKRKLSNIIK